MKKLGALVLVLSNMLFSIPCVLAANDQNTQAQIDNLQAQVKAMQEQSQNQIAALQSQIEVLKSQTAQDSVERVNLLTKLSKAEMGPIIKFTKPYRLRKEDALQEEGKLNISGEIALQFKEPTRGRTSQTGTLGFRAYEIPELFLDANLTDSVSFFVEIPLAYEGGGTSLEDGWIDLHFPGKIASAGNTGVKLGQFHVPFGWDNDDNEPFTYGGRTSIDNTLVRMQRVDGQRLRERQIGIQGNYALDVAKALKIEAEDPLKLVTSVGVFNGNGQTGNGQEWDNDDRKDVVTRVEGHFLNTVFGGSYWWSPRTRKVAAVDVNNTAHTRDIKRYGMHFKYPESTPLPAQDISMAGNRWLLWGEWIFMKAENSVVPNEADVRPQGSYLEFDYGITPKLVGYLRTDFYDHDRETASNSLMGYTVGARWEFWKVCQLIVDYERDNFESSATNPADRVAGMFKVYF